MTIQKQFDSFHAHNPQIYQAFARFTFHVIARGFKRFSADAIMHRVRWETNVEYRGYRYKINNNFVALYARLFMKDFPQYSGFFEIRQRRA